MIMCVCYAILSFLCACLLRNCFRFFVLGSEEEARLAQTAQEKQMLKSLEAKHPQYNKQLGFAQRWSEQVASRQLAICACNSPHPGFAIFWWFFILGLTKKHVGEYLLKITHILFLVLKQIQEMVSFSSKRGIWNKEPLVWACLFTAPTRPAAATKVPFENHSTSCQPK